jgi:phosphatidylglycerophosphatase A
MAIYTFAQVAVIDLQAHCKTARMMTKSAHFWVATWFGTGMSPRAPGTIGTLATIPAHFLLIQFPSSVHLACIVALVVLGTWSADHLAREMQLKDPQIVVIDESAGVLLALWLVGSNNWLAIVVAVLLFRLLDIVKPWPISAAERLRPAGVGIMADDVVAGIAAGLIARLIVQMSW